MEIQGTLTPCWQECNSEKSLWKISWKFLKELKVKSYLLGIDPKEIRMLSDSMSLHHSSQQPRQPDVQQETER